MLSMLARSGWLYKLCDLPERLAEAWSGERLTGCGDGSPALELLRGCEALLSMS